MPDYVEDFDTFLSTTVDKYVKLSNALGGNVAKQAASVLKGFQEQLTFLLVSSKAKKPAVSGLQSMMGPINDAAMTAMEIKESNRGDSAFNHLSAVNDGIVVLAWVTIENRPYKHVDETLGSAQFYGNKVVKEFKEK